MRAAGARLLGLGFILPILLGAWLATPGSPARPTCAFAAGTHHVAVVVEHGNGAVVSRCVAFAAEQLTGDQVLRLSGIEYATSAYGAYGNAVCQIDGEPATYPPGCWTSTSRYWAMFVSRGNDRWARSDLGISSQQFSDGDALGWRYVAPTIGGLPPSPAGVCARSAPVPAPAPTVQPVFPVAPSPEASATAVAVTPPAPSPSPSPRRAAPAAGPAGPAGPGGPNAGWIATAAGVGALAGLLLLQLVRPLLRR
jgi:hypothetical protein